MVLLTTSEHKKTIKTRIVLSIFCLGVTFLMAAVFLMCTNPVLIFTQRTMRVSNGSKVHDILSKPMENIHVSAFLFNITNAQEFTTGEDQKLKVEEVGPFTYREMRYNDDLEINEEEGVIRYTPRIDIEFIPEESVARPEDVNVTMPNLAMLGLASQLSTYSYWTRAGFNLLANQLKSKPIITTDARTYLWGYKEPLVTLGHKVIPGFVHFERLGILDRLYDKKDTNHLELSAKEEDKFIIKKRNGHKKLPMGNMKDPDSCEICNDFQNAYEGVFYPSPVTPQTPVRIFRNGLCRMLDMVYHKQVVLDNGADGLVFNLSDSFYSLDPNVTKNRMLDLSACFFGLPVALTKVNFLEMDPEIYERIEGLKQDPKKNCFIIIEPTIPLEMETYFPVQINLLLKDMRFNEHASPFSNMLLPVGYLEIIQPPLPKDTLEVLDLIYKRGPMMVLISKIVFTLLAAIFISYAILLYCINKNKSISKTNDLQNKIIQEPLMNSK